MKCIAFIFYIIYIVYLFICLISLFFQHEYDSIRKEEGMNFQFKMFDGTKASGSSTALAILYISHSLATTLMF